MHIWGNKSRHIDRARGRETQLTLCRAKMEVQVNT
jgi:hypothetical protein